MRQANLFTKTRHDAPKDEVSKNASLLIRAGFIHKEMAGVYSFLPLGLKVIENLKKIVREEMNSVGGQELSLTALQSKELWEKTGRWNDVAVDNWFKTKLKNDQELGLGFSHEEPMTNLLRDHIRSYKDLPMAAYQFQTKFRNEARAKSGILRGREFLMKDMYTFSRTPEEHVAFYEKIKSAYVRVFERAGIGAVTHLTFASGGIFSKYSHEFQAETEAGEDIVYLSGEKNIAVNNEVYTDEVLDQLGIDKSSLIEKKAIEVGNIFSLGTRFSEALDLSFVDETGTKKFVIMGCYGIGISRLMGSVVEVFGKEESIVWPDEVSPFKIHLIDLSMGEEAVSAATNSLYQKFNGAALLDDRDMRAGEKFADSDLIGIPVRIISSKKNLEKGVFEVIDRKTDETTFMSESDILQAYVK